MSAIDSGSENDPECKEVEIDDIQTTGCSLHLLSYHRDQKLYPGQIGHVINPSLLSIDPDMEGMSDYSLMFDNNIEYKV